MASDPVQPPEEAVERALGEVRALRAALERLRGEEAELTRSRDVAILELVASGMSYEAVARASGLTRGRIGQIVQRRSG